MSKFEQWSKLTSDLFAKTPPLHRPRILDRLGSEPVAFADAQTHSLSLPSSRQTEYWNVLDPEADIFTQEYVSGNAPAAFVHGDRPPQNLEEFDRIYFASSPNLTSIKLKVLQSDSKSDIDFGVAPLSLGLWQSKILKSQIPWSNELRDQILGRKFFRLSTLAYDIAGATITHQLAILLGSFTHLVRNYDGLLTAKELFEMCSFEVSLTANTLLGVAELQSLRLLLARLAEVYEVEEFDDLRIFAMMSPRHLASREVSNNILRLASVNAAALMGGASGCVQLAPDTFSTNSAGRMARNMDLILRKESFLAQVNDPTLGSYSVDQACTAMAEEAWNFFREIEGKEGLQHALSSGWLQKEIAYENQKAIGRFLQQQDKMTGVNNYVLSKPLSPDRPLVKSTDVRSIESWYMDYTDQSSAEKLCDVERAKPIQLSELFERWQFKADDLAQKNLLKKVFLKIEPGLEGHSKTKQVSELLALAGLSVTTVHESKKYPFCTIVVAADPESGFVEEAVAECRARGKGLCLWAGERNFNLFDGFVGKTTPLSELYETLFKNLGGTQ